MSFCGDSSMSNCIIAHLVKISFTLSVNALFDANVANKIERKINDELMIFTICVLWL